MHSSPFVQKIAINCALSFVWCGMLSADITERKQVLDGIPREVLQPLGGSPEKAAEFLPKIQEAIAKNAVGKTATFKTTVFHAGVHKFGTEERSSIVLQTAEKVRQNGVLFSVDCSASMDVSENAKVAKLKKGDRITVTGSISQIQLHYHSNLLVPGCLMIINLKDAKLQ